MTEPRDAVRDTLAAINAAWLDGPIEGMAFHLHEDVVFTAGHDRRVTGRAACIDSYRRFRASAQVLAYHADEPVIDLVGDTAIAVTAWSMKYVLESQEFDEAGHEIFAFVIDEARWKGAWRHVQAEPRR